MGFEEIGIESCPIGAQAGRMLIDRSYMGVGQDLADKVKVTRQSN